MKSRLSHSSYHQSRGCNCLLFRSLGVFSYEIGQNHTSNHHPFSMCRTLPKQVVPQTGPPKVPEPLGQITVYLSERTLASICKALGSTPSKAKQKQEPPFGLLPLSLKRKISCIASEPSLGGSGATTIALQTRLLSCVFSTSYYFKET